MPKKTLDNSTLNDNNLIVQENVHDLIDLMFDERYEMYSFQHNSYNQFINEIVFKELKTILILYMKMLQKIKYINTD